MQDYYKKHLREPLFTRSLVDDVGSDKSKMLEALCYMQDIDGWWSGLTGEFPLAENGAITVNEQVLVCKTFGDLLARVYEWNYVNPKRKSSPLNESLSFGTSGQSPGFFMTQVRPNMNYGMSIWMIKRSHCLVR